MVVGVTFLLVLIRMAGLVQAHKQAMTREQVLRQAAAELVSASGRKACTTQRLPPWVNLWQEPVRRAWSCLLPSRVQPTGLR